MSDHEPPYLTYRVATVAADAPWEEVAPGHHRVFWTLCRPVFPNRHQAEGYAQAAMKAGATNAAILEQRGGQVQVPDGLHVREEQP